MLNICVNVEEQSREAEEWVILAAMAVWKDGSYKVLHYKILLEKSKVIPIHESVTTLVTTLS